MSRILAIDPSGTGTSGTFLIDIHDEDNSIIFYEFYEFKNDNWREHLKFFVNLVREKEPNIIIFEDTTYIYGRQHQGTVGLYKLIGGIVGLEHTFDFVKQVGSIAVNSVKGFRDRVQTGTEDIEGLFFSKGRGHGWKYKGERISLHKVDALVVYHLWSREHLKTKEEIQTEIDELRTKKRLGIRQKEKLEKLENILNVERHQ